MIFYGLLGAVTIALACLVDNRDVYKRQGMDGKRFALCLFKKGWIILAAALAGAAVAAGIYLFAALVLGGKPEYPAVSYTHLAVYKRQALTLSPMMWTV